MRLLDRQMGGDAEERSPEKVAWAHEDSATFYLHVGFWAYREYRIETGRWAGVEVTQKVVGDEELPYSTQVAHATFVSDPVEAISSGMCSVEMEQ